MVAFNTVIRKSPLLWFMGLTFVISWGGILLAIGPEGIFGIEEIPETLLPLVYLATLLGPGAAGIIMTWIVHGKDGLREMLGRLQKWQVGARWYAMAVLTAPLLILMLLVLLSIWSRAFLPAVFTAEDKLSLLITGILMGLTVGLFEEIGWTGFALPLMREKFSSVTAGLLLGLIWGLWHLPLFTGSLVNAGSIPPIFYVSILLFSFLPAYRILMVWVYDHTTSLLMIVLMHAPLAASQLLLIPQSLTGEQIVIYDLLFAVLLWILVAIITLSLPKQNPNVRVT